MQRLTSFFFGKEEMASVAMVGLGLFAAGAIVKTASTLTGLPEPPNPFEKLPRD